MATDHVGPVVNRKNSVNSIFSLFTDLTSENNQNPKYCVDLVQTLRGDRFSIGSTNSYSYSVKRIIKTLGSTRLHSQCGCFSALTCILKYGACSVEDVMEILDQVQKPVNGATKSELNALNVSCILTCGAVIHSGAFVDQSIDIQQSVLKKMIDAGRKKSYLFALACRFIADVIALLDEKQFNDTVWPICKTELFEDLKCCTFDSYYILAICMLKSPKTVNKFLKPKLNSSSQLLKDLIKILFGKSVKNNHPIYEKVALLLCNRRNIIVDVWSQTIEDNAKINDVKDNAILTLFYQIMKNLKDLQVVPSLLLPKFVDVLIKVLTQKKSKTPKDSNCFALAKDSLTLVTNLLKTDGATDEIRLETIKKLLLYPANMKFELKTGTKIIQSLVLQLNLDSVQLLLDIYRHIITDDLKKLSADGREECWNNKEKQLALNSFVKTISHSTVKNNSSLLLNELKFIFGIGFLSQRESIAEIKEYAKEIFFKAIILQMPTLKDLVSLLDDLAVYVNDQIVNKAMDVGDEVVDLWVKQYSVVQQLSKASDNKLFIAVHVLLVYMSFQLFTDVELAKSGIDELLACYSHLKNVHRENRRDGKRQSMKTKKGNGVADEPDWTEVTVDLMLSLLSRENKLWRHVISCIFPQIVTSMTPNALHQIIDALDPKSESVVLEHVNSEESESESSDDGEESSSNGSDMDDHDDDDDDVDDKANDQLRMAVREALGYSAAALTDDESVDMDDMNEEEERTLNERLGQAFRMFKSGSREKKKKQTKEEEALMHFRLRVLDLVDIYTNNSPSMRGCLNLMLPLLNLLEMAVRDQHQMPLRKRVESVLKGISSVKAFSRVEEDNESVIKDVFEAVVGKKEMSALVFAEMARRISECTAFLVRCSQVLARTESGPILLVDEYNSLLKAFFQLRDLKLPIGMFQLVLKMTWKGNYYLVKTLFHFLANANIRVFKKIKVIQLLQLFYKNEKLHSSSTDRLKVQLTEMESNFIKKFIEFLSGSNEKGEMDTTEKMYASFYSHIIMLINAIRINFNRHRLSMTEKSPPWQRVILALSSIETLRRNRRTNSQLENVANLFNVKIDKCEKEPKITKNDDDGRDDDDDGDGSCREDEEDEQTSVNGERPRKRKRKMSSGGAEFRKKGRDLRLKASSDGLQVFRFSSLAVDALPNSQE